MPSNKVQAVLKRLQDLHPETIDMGLGRTFDLLEKLGNPQDTLPPVLHIAGTNGKGSTLSFIQAILEDAGLRVHRYTSPELVRFNERYIIAGTEISDTNLIKLLEEVERVNNGNPITFFEITTACAFKAFADNDADVVLLETGLGGRLDSTNVVMNTAVNVITSISKDHEAFLGDTPAKIALEKAGILRPMTSAIVAPQQDDGATFALHTCINRIGAFPQMHRVNWDYTITQNGFSVSYNGGTIACPHPNLVGMHQYENASVAIVACQALRSKGLKISKENCQNGVAKAVHRGRFEHIKTGLAKNLAGKDIYLDGGHNPSASAAIKTSLEKMGAKNLTLVCGMLEGKDTAGFIAPIKSYIKTVLCVPIKDNPFSTAPGQNPIGLAETFKQCGIDDVTACTDLQDAIGKLKNDENPIILCAGSLHLIGDILALEDTL